MRALVRIVGMAIVVLLSTGAAWPQTEAGAPAVSEVDAAGAVPRPAAEVPEADAASAPETALLDDDTLDELVAPVALYPDALLAQVLVAATYPLDVMKADRFLADNPDLGDKERSDKAGTEGWDESVAVLAGGFPDVIRRLADDIDWTQNLGDAMVAQTDDVFDAVQRMRAQAMAAGNLASNAAQTVDAEGDSIAIEPADPQVVYVPTYDPEAAYVAPPAAAPVPAQPVATQPVTTADGLTTGDLITTGVVAFGSAMLVDAIFDDDDDWDDYWRGPPPIHWDDDDFRPRPDIDVNGDVNIDRSRDRNRVRIGDRPGVGGGWEPSADQRAAAQDRLAARQATGAGRARPAAGLDQAQRDRIKARGDAADVQGKLQAKAPAAGGRAARPPAKRQADSALAPGRGDRVETHRAAARGSTSLKRDQKPAVAKQRASTAAHAKQVSRPAANRTPPRAAPAKASVLKKQGGGQRARAASSRGHAGRRR